MEQYEATKRNKVKRIPKRGIYEKEIIYEILDAGFVCHVAFHCNEEIYVIPTAYGRQGENILFHGSAKSRMMQHIQAGNKISICVTHLDAIVLARSLFHSSMNYRSAVLFGQGKLIEGEEKMEALKCISDQIVEGRWKEARLPNEKELKATAVVEVKIDSASAKVGSGGPLDDKEDYSLPIWTGVLPVHQRYGPPVADDQIGSDIAIPPSVLNLKSDI